MPSKVQLSYSKVAIKGLSFLIEIIKILDNGFLLPLELLYGKQKKLRKVKINGTYELHNLGQGHNPLYSKTKLHNSPFLVEMDAVK